MAAGGHPADRNRGDLLKGTLDMLILRALRLTPMHGWGIVERIQQWSEQILQVNQGSLYPALYRLQEQGWIAAEWQVTVKNRRARYYSLTSAGASQLLAEERDWERLSRAVNLVLRGASA